MSKNIRRTPYCATCEKAGKPESVYRGHFTKDAPGGIVVCPTIKGFKCKECGSMGHIANEKYCPVLRSYARSDKLVANAKKRAECVLRSERAKQVYVSSKKSDFALAFEEDSEDDESIDDSLDSVNLTPVLHTDKVSYKDVLSKTAIVSSVHVVCHKDKFQVISSAAFSSNGKKTRSWADDYSSDGEDD